MLKEIQISPPRRNWPPLQKREKERWDSEVRESLNFLCAVCWRNHIQAVLHVCIYISATVCIYIYRYRYKCVCVCVLGVWKEPKCQVSYWSRQTFSAFYLFILYKYFVLDAYALDNGVYDRLHLHFDNKKISKIRFGYITRIKDAYCIFIP